jgi:Transcriptional activator of glycolytic enzymes
MATEPRATALDDPDQYQFPTDAPDYRPYITSLMNFNSNYRGRQEIFTNQDTFNPNQFVEITAGIVHRWMFHKTFRKVYINTNRPLEDNGRPCEVFIRSTTLHSMKTAVSYYMPDRLSNWHYTHGQIARPSGNPTKSMLVNNFIADIVQMEVRGEGLQTNAKRPVTQLEFRKTLKLLATRGRNVHTRLRYATMCLWQYHLMGRADDLCHFLIDDPRGHPTYDFAIQTKVRWSKNIRSEERCHPQILMGSMDPAFCIQLRLAMYLENYLLMCPDTHYLFTEKNTPKASGNLNNAYHRILQTVVWNDAEFQNLAPRMNDAGIGTHSYRKFPASYAQACGKCDSNYIEVRGRWKGAGGNKVVYRYIDRQLPYYDAYVAAVLCVGGAIKYALKDGVEISDHWLFTNVVPKIRHKFEQDNGLCRVLALSLLFGCLDDNVKNMIPDVIVERVCAAYNALGLDVTQPVEKILLQVDTENEKLVIRQKFQDGSGDASGSTGSHFLASSQRGDTTVSELNYRTRMIEQRQEQHALALGQQMTEGFDKMNNQMNNRFDDMTRLFNNNARRYGNTLHGAVARQVAPQQRVNVEANVEANVAAANNNQPATLSDNIKTLDELWTEYISGIDGRKPAMSFTKDERKSSKSLKQKYYRRNLIWQKIQLLINSGLQLQPAMERFREHYGRGKSVTWYIETIIDERTGRKRKHGEA